MQLAVKASRIKQVPVTYEWGHVAEESISHGDTREIERARPNRSIDPLLDPNRLQHPYSIKLRLLNPILKVPSNIDTLVLRVRRKNVMFDIKGSVFVVHFITRIYGPLPQY